MWVGNREDECNHPRHRIRRAPPPPAPPLAIPPGPPLPCVEIAPGGRAIPPSTGRCAGDTGDAVPKAGAASLPVWYPTPPARTSLSQVFARVPLLTTSPM